MIAQKVMAVKQIEIASMQFLSTSFLRKLAVFFLQRNDAPSLALLACEWVEIAWSDRTRSAGHSSTSNMLQKNREAPKTEVFKGSQ